jgi:hypothetical protein
MGLPAMKRSAAAERITIAREAGAAGGNRTHDPVLTKVHRVLFYRTLLHVVTIRSEFLIEILAR